MARLQPVYKPSDHPQASDPDTRKDLTALFDFMFPGQENPEFPQAAAGYAIAALNPKLALMLVQPGRYMIREMNWSQRSDLKELAVQTANLRVKCGYSFEAHIGIAAKAGISEAQQAVLGTWETSTLLNDEQKLVVEYADAVVTGGVSDALFNRVVEAYGEQGAVEFTIVVAWWTFWAMILNAVRPSFADFA